jgi:hypothetical protein
MLFAPLGIDEIRGLIKINEKWLSKSEHRMLNILIDYELAEGPFLRFEDGNKFFIGETKTGWTGK